nr:DUF333 domain-containing protein [Sodalis glossinidius]
MKRQISLALFASFILICCSTGEKSSSTPAVGMANPASVYCEQLGGKSKIVPSAAGATSYCTLPNGEQVDEWALYRQDHRAH